MAHAAHPRCARLAAAPGPLAVAAAAPGAPDAGPLLQAAAATATAVAAAAAAVPGALCPTAAGALGVWGVAGGP